MPTESPFDAVTIGTRVRFDDQGITIRNLFRTHRIGWAEVRCFTENWGEGGWLAVVLHDGRTVIADRTAPNSETLIAVGLAAEHYGIPANLTGTIKRGTFPATLLGTTGTIRVTLRDMRMARNGQGPIVEVTERTEPVQVRDILTLSHDGTEVEVLGVRQIFAADSWEQHAEVGDIQRHSPRRDRISRTFGNLDLTQ